MGVYHLYTPLSFVFLPRAVLKSRFDFPISSADLAIVIAPRHDAIDRVHILFIPDFANNTVSFRCACVTSECSLAYIHLQAHNMTCKTWRDQ
jgi:hypothetical protein